MQRLEAGCWGIAASEIHHEATAGADYRAGTTARRRLRIGNPTDSFAVSPELPGCINRAIRRAGALLARHDRALTPSTPVTAPECLVNRCTRRLPDKPAPSAPHCGSRRWQWKAQSPRSIRRDQRRQHLTRLERDGVLARPIPPGTGFELHPHAVQMNRMIHHGVVDQRRCAERPG